MHSTQCDNLEEKVEYRCIDSSDKVVGADDTDKERHRQKSNEGGGRGRQRQIVM